MQMEKNILTYTYRTFWGNITRFDQKKKKKKKKKPTAFYFFDKYNVKVRIPVDSRYAMVLHISI